MAIVAVFEFPDHTIDEYNKVFEIGGQAILDQPARLYHVAHRNGDGFTAIDVWESEAAFADFGEVIGPALQELGLTSPPKVYPAVRTVDREGSLVDL